MDFTTPPNPERLAAELSGTLRPGVTTKALIECPALLSLALVRAKSASAEISDLASAAHGLLRELVLVVDGQSDGPVSTLLGLATGTRGTLLKERRRQTAQLLFISPAHLRTSDREVALIESLADELYARDSAYRLRHRHRTTREQEPAASGLAVDWLERHQAYRRVWTPVAALRDDLWVLLKFLRKDQRESDIVDRLMTMSWRYAQYRTELERFIADYGGLWLLADVDSEIELADAVQRIGILVPFGAADDSWLRLVLRDTATGELDPFSDRLMAEERGQEVLGAWLAWAKECSCELGESDPEACTVHDWIAAVDNFSRLLDDDWVAVADWYRLDKEGEMPRGATIDQIWRHDG
jgi:hypothetical protein